MGTFFQKDKNPGSKVYSRFAGVACLAALFFFIIGWFNEGYDTPIMNAIGTACLGVAFLFFALWYKSKGDKMNVYLFIFTSLIWFWLAADRIFEG
ncbi:hypothetical protein [Fictibacillus fluitans]|uniref:Uncharacterized protein n=1 Tax=Fictibacillus fluitans TaxID=3058422 RepID=A0ABT8HW97_9BACL|nr:hypothetical protein [Fictibacillus sp. NE201]MDN4525058.1 hypothetical protein [Fictibacillus sp. NE201]